MVVVYSESRSICQFKAHQRCLYTRSLVSVDCFVPGAGGVGLLDGDLIDPGLVDPVDDCVPQFAHQLQER